MQKDIASSMIFTPVKTLPGVLGEPRLKEEVLQQIREERFNYDVMRPVYIIVLMEQSPKEFHQYADTYIHHSVFHMDSGIPFDNLLNFIYIPLDIFRKMPHNNLTELEAWLYFLSSDNPGDVKRIIEKYPFFEELYKEIIEFRYRPEELIIMYSESLLIADRNTIRLMIDEAREERDVAIAEAKASVAAAKKELEDAKKEVEAAAEAKAEMDKVLAEKDAEIARLRALLEKKGTE